MSFYSELKDKIRRNRIKDHNCIPFLYDRFRYDWPGIVKDNYTILSANSGIGKSKLLLNHYIDIPLTFCQQENVDIEVDIHIWPLEEGREKLYYSFICQELYRQFDNRIDIKTLKGIFKDRRINDETSKQLDSLDSWFDFFESKVTIHEEKVPYFIFEKAKKILLSRGKLVKKTQVKDGVENVITDYVADNPELITVIILDPTNLLSTSKTRPSSKEAMGYWSGECALELRDVYHCQIVDVQQQAADKEKQEFNQGKTIAEKLEPSLDGLGDDRTTQRNANEVIGLFSPARYDLVTHSGYDISYLGNHYRSVKILKSRDGTPNAKIGLFFDGATNHFEELPKEMNGSDYHRYLSRVKDNPVQLFNLDM